MPRLAVRHESHYRYATPVTFGDHSMMFRPRDSHDLRLLSATLDIQPAPTAIRWRHDVFGNSVAIASFDQPSDNLSFVSQIEIDHFDGGEPDSPIEPYAETYPFSYSLLELPDLVRSIERHYPDPGHAVDLWARRFLRKDGPTRTMELLAELTGAIKRDGFNYEAREAEGVQSPAETLRLKSGTCRDFALLMMEAVRALNFAARFVSGYLYVPQFDQHPRNGADATEGGNRGAGATHAWVQVYLPGAGWVEFDPTNAIVGNRDLIRVAVARDPAQAVPLTGTWTGTAGDFLGLSVDVQVRSIQPQPRSQPVPNAQPQRQSQSQSQPQTPAAPGSGGS